MHLAHGECRSKQQDAVAAQAAQGMAEVEWQEGEEEKAVLEQEQEKELKLQSSRWPIN